MSTYDLYANFDLSGAVAATSSALHYTQINRDGTLTVFEGSGFSYNASGHLIAGNLTQITMQSSSGTILQTITQNLPTIECVIATLAPTQSARDQITWFNVIDPIPPTGSGQPIPT